MVPRRSSLLDAFVREPPKPLSSATAKYYTGLRWIWKHAGSQVGPLRGGAKKSGRRLRGIKTGLAVPVSVSINATGTGGRKLSRRSQPARSPKTRSTEDLCPASSQCVAVKTEKRALAYRYTGGVRESPFTHCFFCCALPCRGVE